MEFRKLINEFSETLSKTEDEKFADKLIINFKEKILENNYSWQEKLSILKQEAETSLLYSGIPLLTTSLITSFASKPHLDLQEITKGILLASVATLTNVGKEIRNKWSHRKSNYYLHIKKHLTSDQNTKLLIPNINTMLDEFIYD